MEIIISQVNKWIERYLKKTNKFGVEFPKSVTDAYAIHEQNSKTLWADSISKETKYVKPTFRKNGG